MKFRWRAPVKALLARRGYVSIDRSQSDIEPEFLELYLICKPKTMTSVERMYALCKAVEYIARQDIVGDIVECGVWRGGSAMLAALTLQRRGDRRRHLYLYDTYKGMSEPADIDVNVLGSSARERWVVAQRDDYNAWAYAPLEEVEKNIRSTGFPMDRVHLIAGKVEDTIPTTMPKQIALLRLDTDFYESTAHELRHLFPLLSPGGVLIVDDYGHWAGSRRAVDEYFAQHAPPMLLNRIDSNGRVGVRVAS
jgi:O-methyltransferase